MNRSLKTLCSLVLLALLGACGGGGSDSGPFTVNRALDSTTYSCPTQAAYNLCVGGDCGQCTCTVGCDPNAPKAKLAVTMTPGTVAVGEAATLSLTLSNAESFNQTVRFSLGYPLGAVRYDSVGFSSPCVTTALNVGPTSFVATVVVPARTAGCGFDVRKSFITAANPVPWTLTDLSRVELQGVLPSVTVTP